MEFEWDEKKAAVNARKHRVAFLFASRVFLFASRVFLDPNRLEWADARGSYGESRWVTVGLVEGFEIAVSYTLRGDTIRIISARKAERHEREDYWNR
jgi:uncharacterized protein